VEGRALPAGTSHAVPSCTVCGPHATAWEDGLDVCRSAREEVT
jgi:hypothetical protein